MGRTQVFCSVFGPKEKQRGNKSQDADITCTVASFPHLSHPNSLTLDVPDPDTNEVSETLALYEMERLSIVNPFSTTLPSIHSQTDKRKQQATNDENVLLSSTVLSSIRSAIRGEVYKKSCIEVSLMILSDDGGLLPACINAATLALVDANIELISLICTSQVHVFPGNSESGIPPRYFLDPSRAESTDSAGSIVVSVLWDVNQYIGEPNAATDSFVTSSNTIAHFEAHGSLTDQEIDKATELCLSGCTSVGAAFRTTLLNSHDPL
ncbi:putative 3' exoribonuclease family, domain 1 [Blattamonas nauphoetae]|uniref:3' exoribonuclease family, domain 1 n=1 Tax=Blattamonas nauphoetae TaxID=2049346 RepID=A0ABQ9Y135_9EUKA|nr:putative 3' exoribonuclease family, domain 1 [Blattamonas nauphoetae]